MVLRNKNSYPKICFKIIEQLKEKLPNYLSYHSMDHIIDVANVCNDYIEYYDIPEEMAKLLRIAAICHDYGYIESSIDHEERSIVAIKPFLSPILNSKEVEIVNGMIRATKVPQEPKTFYEEILADADLDYLGRKDYDEISTKLFNEYLHFDIVSNKIEWLDLQIWFLENHKFHTDFAKKNRQKLKFENIKELKSLRLAANL
ncbi:HD domain-containing protein [uncultured Eudoraea sp.]|jgi:predicted metal-dependent HD superfamily phosphohydrolase|uniref:HD domain-containing protein n=1 Tax=uncultured Eudoraea sp. TaxID=1035614 RepID=UPI00262DC539|nr:HD domain-containing protein [uncultured Eudoraea sp.]